MVDDEGHEPRLPEDYFRRTSGARIYDYILGGKDNYPIDWEAGEAALKAWPGLRTSMRANRAFMRKVARYLAAEAGITQFLDIGTGLPTSPNLHEVVQAESPAARVVYTDYDPVVLAHARALLTNVTPDGVTTYVEADLRNPDSIMGATELTTTLDLSQPVGVTIIAMLHFLDDDQEAQRVVHYIMDRLPAGSYLALSTATGDFDPLVTEVKREYEQRGETMCLRTKAQVERFFDGLDLLEPGVVQVHKWLPGAVATGTVTDIDRGVIADADVAMYGAVARKPG